MTRHYYIVYNPPTPDLMELFGKISHPKELLAFLCDKKAEAIDHNNFSEYLEICPEKQKVGMADTLAMECYALTYVANMIDKYDGRAKIILSDGKRRTPARIIAQQQQAPAAVFISAMSANFPSALAAAWVLNHGKVPVVIGGIHISTSPEDLDIYLRQYAPFPDLITQVVGPADSNIMGNLMQDLASRRLQPAYYGRISLENGVWGSKNILPMEPLKFENLKRIPLLGNFIADRIRINAAAPYLGCPFSCRFCSISTLPKKQRKFIVRDPVDFIDELKSHQQGGINSHNRFFFLLPDNLLLGGKKLVEILDRIISQRLKINFAAQISIDVADDLPLLHKLRRAGATHFFIGFESLDLRNLEHIGKNAALAIRKSGLSAAQYYRKKIKQIQNFGISIHGSFIVGLPYDYFNTLEDNTGAAIADFCIENHIGLQPSVFTDLPGSINHRESQIEGNYLYGKHGTWEYFVALCLSDLTESNRIPVDSLKNSPLLVFYMAYHAISRVGDSRKAIVNALFTLRKSLNYPTCNGRVSFKQRLEDGLWSFAAQLFVSQYKDHAEMLAYSQNGVPGTFERLYNQEKDPTVKKLFAEWVPRFSRRPSNKTAKTKAAFLQKGPAFQPAVVQSSARKHNF